MTAGEEDGTHIFDMSYCLSNTDPNIDQSFATMPWSPSFFCTGKPDFDNDGMTQVRVCKCTTIFHDLIFKGNPKNIMCDANNSMSNKDPTGSPIFCADGGYAALSGLLVKTHGCEEAGSANAFVAIREWNDWIQTVTDAKYPVVWETPTSNYLPPAGYCGTTAVRDNLIQADLSGADNTDKIQGGEEIFNRWSFLGRFLD